jgi:hypothetical protein
MKGGERIFNAMGNKTPEAHVIRQEGGLSFMELAEKSMKQAERALVSLGAIVQPHVSEILTATTDEAKESLCLKIAENNKRLIPDHIESEREQAAYIMATVLALTEGHTTKTQ